MTDDRFVQHLAVIFLGLVVLVTVAGGIVLAWSDKSLPGEIIAIGAAAGGVLGGMFSNLGKTSEPAPVQVVNEPEQAVPVAEARPRRTRGDKGVTSIELCLIVLTVAIVLYIVHVW